jgi:hypothetical protein
MATSKAVKVEKDKNMDLYVLPKKEKRALVEKTNADPNYASKAVLKAVCSFYVY